VQKTLADKVHIEDNLRKTQEEFKQANNSTASKVLSTRVKDLE
jgi:hypothetical protein